ncbi:ultraviolet-B receptor UVR8 [Rhodamnia argentea]|uniref:Ultraviolet-B receptor UVR8 n=1 Tax=Rhodamnia argentea TaxID=178133 RepID=A0A8B8QZK9_9MYRT|nr:ultraviolet-B receptor UVR8 [Rhodamnia argentea]
MMTMEEATKASSPSSSAAAGGGGEEEEVWSWGAGTDGQLGTGRLGDEHLPRLLSLSLPSSISLLACGGAHAIALSSGGRAFSWGRGISGQLGHGEVASNCLTPKAVTSLEGYFITGVSAGWSHSGFVSDAGCLFTCGDGSFGQLGHGNHESCSSPAEVSYFSSKHVDQIACGLRHSLVLLKGDHKNGVYGFGSCKRGQLGPTSNRTRSTGLPQAIQGLENIEIASVVASGDHSAALSSGGRVYTWGRGFPGFSDAHSPVELPSSLQIKQIALGWNHALVLTDGGEAFILGGNRHGVLGNLEKLGLANNTPDVSTLVLERVPGLDGIKVMQIAAGAEHSALVTEDLVVMTWGWGEHGQLGLGSACDWIEPQEVSLGHTLSGHWAKCSIYCGSGFTFVMRSRTSSGLHQDD